MKVQILFIFLMFSINNCFFDSLPDSGTDPEDFILNMRGYLDKVYNKIKDNIKSVDKLILPNGEVKFVESFNLETFHQQLDQALQTIRRIVKIQYNIRNQKNLVI